MANRKLPGTVSPQEIITDLWDKRLFEITFAGISNNHSGMAEHLVEQGLMSEDIKTAIINPLDKGHSQAFKELLEVDPELQKEHDKWYVDLYMGGFKRLFGYKAANRQTELRAVHHDYDSHPIPTPVYIGELPELLSEQITIDALQSRLDMRYGKHGVLMGPPPVVMALYEDMAVSLRPAARTLIQGKTEVWQLEARTDLRGPGRASMAA